jgi:hypothetical protein
MKMTLLAAMVAVMCMGTWAYAENQPSTDQNQVTGASSDVDTSPGATPRSGDSVSEPGTAGRAALHQGMEGHEVLAPALIQSPNEMQIQGKVVSHKNVGVASDKEHHVLRVQTKSGQIMDVDLGHKDRLPAGFDLKDGQWVIVTGVQGRLDNNNVLVAHNLASVYNFGAEGSMPSGSTGKMDKETRDISKDYNKDVSKEVRDTVNTGKDTINKDTTNSPKDTKGY